MPFLIPFLIGGTVGGVVGFATGDGIGGASRIVKYAVVGGAAFAVYKLVKK